MMSDPVLKAVENERRALRARLAALDEIERQLKRAPRPNGVVVVQPRAPSGALRDSMLAALRREKRPIMSRPLKLKVIHSGYDHHLNDQYWTKVLRSLVDEGIVTKTPNGSFSEYQLKRD